MPIQAPDLNQDALNKLQAQEQFPQVQEQQVRKVEIAKDTIQWQVALALEMMKAWKTPVMNIKKYPLLAWSVPQGYFDSEKQENNLKYINNFLSQFEKQSDFEELKKIIYEWQNEW